MNEFAGYRRFQPDLAVVRRMTQRVGRKILQCLFETIGIANHELCASPDMGDQADSARRAFPLVTSTDPIEQSLDGDGLAAQRRAPSFQPREIQQIADDVFESMGFV